MYRASAIIVNIPSNNNCTLLIFQSMRIYIFFVIQKALEERNIIVRSVKCLVFYLLIHRSISLTSSVVLSFLVHTECVPCGGTEDLFLGYVVHTYGNTEYGAKRDKVSSDMSV